MAHQNMKKKFITSDEINVLKDSILKLRNTFKPNHPLQFIINTLEQGFFTIIDRVNTPVNITTTNHQQAHPLTSSPPGAASTSNFQPQGNNKLQAGQTSSIQPQPSSASSVSSTSSTSSSTSSATSIKTDKPATSTSATTVPVLHYASTSSLHVPNVHNNYIRTQTSQPIILNNNNSNQELKKQQPQNYNNSKLSFEFMSWICF